MGLRAYGLGFRVEVEGLGLRVYGLSAKAQVYGLGFNRKFPHSIFNISVL